MRRVIGCVLIALLLAACSEKEENPVGSSTTPAPVTAADITMSDFEVDAGSSSLVLWFGKVTNRNTDTDAFILIRFNIYADAQHSTLIYQSQERSVKVFRTLVQSFAYSEDLSNLTLPQTWFWTITWRFQDS